jgi:hypothetical protein
MSSWDALNASTTPLNSGYQAHTDTRTGPPLLSGSPLHAATSPAAASTARILRNLSIMGQRLSAGHAAATGKGTSGTPSKGQGPKGVLRATADPCRPPWHLVLLRCKTV